MKKRIILLTFVILITISSYRAVEAAPPVGPDSGSLTTGSTAYGNHGVYRAIQKFSHIGATNATMNQHGSANVRIRKYNAATWKSNNGSGFVEVTESNAAVQKYQHQYTGYAPTS